MRCSPHAALIRLGLVAAIAAAALTGCNGGSGGYPTQINANVRVINAIPDSGSISVFLTPVPNTNSGIPQETTTVVQGLPFEGLTPNYVSVPEGPQTLQVAVEGGATFVVNTNITLIGLKNYTLYLFGPSSAVLALPNLDLTANTGTGQFNLSVINGAFGTPAADVYVLPPNVSVDSTTPAISGVPYGSSSAITLLNGGTFSVRFTAIGSKIVLYDSGPITFENAATYQIFMYTKGSSTLLNGMLFTVGGTGPGTVINSKIAQFKLVQVAPGTPQINAYSPATDTSVIVTGFPGTQTAFALQDNNTPPPAGTASVRFINASPDLGPVDVYVDFVKRASSVATNTASPYILLPAADITAPAPNTYAVNFNYPGTQTIALSIPAFAVNAGRTYTLYLAGPASQLTNVQTQDR